MSDRWAFEPVMHLQARAGVLEGNLDEEQKREVEMDDYQRGRRDALTEAAAGMEQRWGMHPRYRDDAVQWLQRLARGETTWATERVEQVAQGEK